MRPTASKLSLAQECLWPWSGPVVWDAGTRGAAARLGSAFHAAVAALINGWPLDLDHIGEWLGLDDEQRETLARMVQGWQRNVAVDKRWKAEIPFLYDAVNDVAEELPPSAERNYPEGNLWAGTADVVWDDGDLLVIRDWKTGQREYVHLPGQNPQLRQLALAGCRARGKERARVELAWVDSDGNVDVEQDELGPFEIAAVAGEIAELEDRLSRGPVEPCTGDHCRRCPAVVSCAETRTAIVAVAPTPPPEPFRVVGTVTEITSPEHATWMLHRVRAVAAAVEVADRVLRQYADGNTGIATGTGAVWKRRELAVERIDLNPDGLALLKRELPGAVKQGTSKTAIREAAKATGQSPTEIEQQIMAALRIAGSVKGSITVRYEDVSETPTPKRGRRKTTGKPPIDTTAETIKTSSTG